MVSIMTFTTLVYANQSISSLKEEADKYFDNGNYNKAAELYIKILSSKRIPLELAAYISYKVGRSYELLENYDKSSKYYYKSLKINKELLNYKAVNILYFRLGNVLEKNDQIEQAIIAFKNTYSISINLKNEKTRAHSAYRLGILLYYNNENGSSLRYFMISLKYHMANDNLKNAGVIAYYIGNIYLEEDRIEDTKHIWKISIKVLKKAGSSEWKIVEQALNSLKD